MRQKLVLGLSLAGLLSGSAAMGQFAADALKPGTPQPKAAPPGGFTAAPPPVGGLSPATPVGPTGYNAPPAATPGTAFQPRLGPAPVVEIPRAIPADHPWALTAETGPFFILVKSYSRPAAARPDPNDPGMTALELANGLASDVRERFKVGAYLFEYISEEKRAEAEARAKAIQQAQAFSSAIDARRQQSQLNGMEFLGGDTTLRYKTFRYRDQIAVLVGPFQTEADARVALVKVKKEWEAPADKRLMDGGAINNAETQRLERGYLNPYAHATVVPNPAVARAAQPAAAAGLDPFVVRLNQGRPYSLLTATKGWTLAVKSFTAPVQITSRDEKLKDEKPSVMQTLGLGRGADVLAAGAEQAEQLAKVLRDMKDDKGRPLGLEAFVLHTRNSSVVTVGQFDGPDDPALQEKRRFLMGLKLNIVKDASGGTPGGDPEFPHVLPIPIPRP